MSILWCHDCPSCGWKAYRFGDVARYKTCPMCKRASLQVEEEHGEPLMKTASGHWARWDKDTKGWCEARTFELD